MNRTSSASRVSSASMAQIRKIERSARNSIAEQGRLVDAKKVKGDFVKENIRNPFSRSREEILAKQAEQKEQTREVKEYNLRWKEEQREQAQREQAQQAQAQAQRLRQIEEQRRLYQEEDKKIRREREISYQELEREEETKYYQERELLKQQELLKRRPTNRVRQKFEEALKTDNKHNQLNTFGGYAKLTKKGLLARIMNIKKKATKAAKPVARKPVKPAKPAKPVARKPTKPTRPVRRRNPTIVRRKA